MKSICYEEVKNLSYEEYCSYLKGKYGNVPYRYGKKENRRPEEGLFIHHIREDVVASLSNSAIAKANDPLYQEPENLVYCNYVEHLLLHILIGEETAGGKNLGLNGPFVFIIPALKNYFEKGWKNEKINAGYYNAIAQDKDVFKILLERYNKIVCDTDLLLEHNATLYPQMENLLNTKNKALVVLGTGLGKTSTALQYLWKNQCRALVIGPNNLIKSGWDKCREWCDTITYQAFAKRYEKIHYEKYGLIILDEAHHVGYDETSGGGAEVWTRGVQYIIDKGIKVLGLTATPQRTDGIDIRDTLFGDCVCEGKALEDAIEEGIIHPFSYVTAIYNTDEIIEEYKDCENTELVGQLNLAINNTPTMKEIFQKYMPNNKRKGIIFIQEIADKPYVLDIFKSIYPNVEYRAIDSLMDKSTVDKNRRWFETTDEGYLLAINMISEGAHYKGVNTLIMFRRTNSYLLYTQQLGRIITLAKDEDPHAIVFDLVNNVDNVEYNDRKVLEGRRYSTSRVLDAIRRRAEKSEQIIVADETRDIIEAIRAIKGFEDIHWTEEEDDIIRKYYPTHGTLCQNRLIGRTKSAIQTRARYLGIKTNDIFVICIETQKIYNLKEAANFAKADKSQIVGCCKGKTNHVKGYHWAYVDDKVLQEKYKMFINKPQYSWIKSIICIETQCIYNSTQEAEKETNIRSGDIQACCKKKQKTAGGYHWAFSDDENGIKNLQKFIGNGPSTTARVLKIYCLETGEMFDSQSKAEEKYGGNIWNALRDIAITAGGYHWCYYDDPKIEQYKKCYFGIKPKDKRIKCYETGEVFDSISKAEEKYGLSSIHAVLDKPNKTSGGYHWAHFSNNNYSPQPKTIPNQKEIYCIELNKYWPSVSDAERELGISGISRCCRNWKFTTKNLHFCFKEDVNNYFPKPKTIPNQKAIYCVEINKTYDSLRSAADFLGCSSSSGISRALKNSNATCGGYHWKYVEEGENSDEM